jgi:hypothetical protein
VESALKKVIELTIEDYLTKALFYLEKESAFKSFFTKTNTPKANDILKKIWVMIFNRLDFNVLRL